MVSLNFSRLFKDLITPVQLDGLRMLVTPLPQEEFNATDDRKSANPSLGVACLDCHVNGHTTGQFHLNPDNRPRERRFRLDTTSLRGMFNQQIHGSKRSLRSVEDFTEFEQRTAGNGRQRCGPPKRLLPKTDHRSKVSVPSRANPLGDSAGPPACSGTRLPRGTPPAPDDIPLLVEVADTTLEFDRSAKVPLFARAGISEVWIVDLEAEAVEVYREPHGPAYGRVERVGRGSQIAVDALRDLGGTVEDSLG